MKMVAYLNESCYISGLENQQTWMMKHTKQSRPFLDVWLVSEGQTEK